MPFLLTPQRIHEHAFMNTLTPPSLPDTIACK